MGKLSEIEKLLEKATGKAWRFTEAKDGYFVADGSNPITPLKYMKREDAELIAVLQRNTQKMIDVIRMQRGTLKEMGMHIRCKNPCEIDYLKAKDTLTKTQAIIDSMEV